VSLGLYGTAGNSLPEQQHNHKQVNSSKLHLNIQLLLPSKRTATTLQKPNAKCFSRKQLIIMSIIQNFIKYLPQKNVKVCTLVGHHSESNDLKNPLKLLSLTFAN
jgi:hypothetical protein